MTNTPHNPSQADYTVAVKARTNFESVVAAAIAASDFATLDSLVNVHSTLLGVSHERWLALKLQVATAHGDATGIANAKVEIFNAQTKHRADG